MAKLKQIVRMLEEQRLELLKQLEGIDRAIAALDGTGPAVAEAPPGAPDVPTEDAASTVVPRQVKARRVLTDAHKRALSAGRRKARDTQDVAKGLAREMPEEGFVPAVGTRDRPLPRLVKKAG